MKILILTFYYSPDLAAGSFRATALVQALRKQMAPGDRIDIFTTLPNRYHTFAAECPALEDDGVVRIHRIALPGHKSGILDQSRAFLAYALKVFQLSRGENYDVVFATSSRLLTAFLGALVSRLKRRPLYLDIRDIFVDTINDVFAGKTWAFYWLFSLMERFSIRSADRVNLVSQGFEDYFRQRYGDANLEFHTNGIDDEFMESASGPAEAITGVATNALGVQNAGPVAQPAAITVLYAGNLGEGQGLHLFLPQLAALLANYNFVVIGDGGRKQALQQALLQSGVHNVTMVPPMNRAELIKRYHEADILMISLNTFPAFEKVLPSKIFEYAATGKPIVAGVSGYAANFVRQEVEDAEVFQPCNAADAARAIRALKLAPTPRAEFIRRYTRRTIMARMAKSLLELARRKRVAA